MHIFIVVPSMSPTGPVKGAVALANALCDKCDVTMIPLRSGSGVEAQMNPAVRFLNASASYFSGISLLNSELKRLGGKKAVVVSFCLSADLAALMVSRKVRWIASVRGNLLQNYFFDYGAMGSAIAVGHLNALRLADTVVAMTDAMADQVEHYIGRRPVVIRNFVDEAPLEAARSKRSGGKRLRFAFVGSLNQRKQPLSLIEPLAKIQTAGHAVILDVIGTGPLLDVLRAKINELSLEHVVVLHGHVTEPQRIVSCADALILPSLSEGTSRAVLESLHLGVPAVLRDIDGNRELISSGINGALFDDPGSLSEAMLNAARLRSQCIPQETLLPDCYRQVQAASAYLQLAELT